MIGRRTIFAALVVLVVGTLFAQAAFAGSPHFIKSSISVTRTNDSLTVSGRESGLGDEPTVDISFTATALCINNGGHHPKAVNKESVSASGEFTVNNGTANFSLTATATFSPPCSPPMTVEFTDLVLTDTSNGLSLSIPGTF